MLNFRKQIISTILDTGDKFYMHIAPLEDVHIGKRGLIDQEKDQGIMLVFGNESFKDFEWDELYIYLSMRFSGSWEHLMIPINAIQTVFDDPVNPKYIFNFKVIDTAEVEQPDEPQKQQPKKEGNVISLDFGGKKGG